ncbi:MAG: hypothetical protein MJ102_02730 [Clostridia bacterium]|nr:hypothetical protein [Clostridia bacterium]
MKKADRFSSFPARFTAFFIALFVTAMLFVSCFGGNEIGSGTAAESDAAESYVAGYDTSDPLPESVTDETIPESVTGSDTGAGPADTGEESSSNHEDHPSDVPGSLADNVKMKDSFVYERPDYDLLEKKTDDLIRMIKEEKLPEDEVKKAYDDLEDRLDFSYTMESINSVRQSEDVSNQKYADESLWLSEKSAALFTKLVKTDVAAFESKYCGALLGDMTEEEIAYLRAMEKLADDEYVELSRKDTELQNKYKSAELDVSITVKGKEYNYAGLEDAGLLSEENNKKWNDAFTEYAGDILHQMIDVRNKIAVKAGYADYGEFAYAIMYERSYTPDDAAKFAEGIKNAFTVLNDQQTYSFSPLEALFINSNYFGGKAVDFSNHIDEYRDYFASVNENMLKAFDEFLEKQYFSVGDEVTRQQGAYTTYLRSYDTPFIFMYRYGGAYNVRSLIHEFGHYYAYYVHGDDMGTDLDICEIHSQMNEMLFTPVWDKIVGEKFSSGIVKYQIYNMAMTVLSGCQEDEFQRIIYANPDKYTSAKDFCALYAELNSAYGISADDTRWAQINHTFEMPFYYISYATSAIPALEGFVIVKNDYPAAIKLYNDLIAEGTKRNFIDLLQKLGLGSPFDPKTIKTLTDDIVKIFG